MSSYYYDGLRDAYHLIQQNQHKKTTNAKNQLEEIYAGRYGTRTTASGRRVDRDEPSDERTQYAQSDAIQKALAKKKAAASKSRLIAKGAVPTKGGKKMFEQFRKDAGAVKEKQLSKKENEFLRQVYLSARNLDEYDKWLYFVLDVLD
jgi:hypothetical protein